MSKSIKTIKNVLICYTLMVNSVVDCSFSKGVHTSTGTSIKLKLSTFYNSALV